MVMDPWKPMSFKLIKEIVNTFSEVKIKTDDNEHKSDTINRWSVTLQLDKSKNESNNSTICPKIKNATASQIVLENVSSEEVIALYEEVDNYETMLMKQVHRDEEEEHEAKCKALKPAYRLISCSYNLSSNRLDRNNEILVLDGLNYVTVRGSKFLQISGLNLKLWVAFLKLCIEQNVPIIYPSVENKEAGWEHCEDILSPVFLTHLETVLYNSQPLDEMRIDFSTSYRL